MNVSRLFVVVSTLVLVACASVISTASAGESIDNEKLLEMIKGGISPKIIMATIAADLKDCHFSYSVKDQIVLNKACKEVSDPKWEETDINTLQLKVLELSTQGIKDLKNLAYLNLYATAVTDAGLDSLKSLTNLRHLYLWQTKVTEAGVKKLKAAMPNLEIVAGWEPEPPKK